MDVDLSRIRHRKIGDFLEKFGLTDPAGLAAKRPFCYDESSAASYRKHSETFIINAGIEKVWQTYVTIHPRDAWKGKMIGFGLQYSRETNTITYLDDPYNGLEKGQIIILNLCLLGGLVNIAVAHEVAEVNEKERFIKLCYLEGSASEGSQWISLKPIPGGFTEITHLTFYRSKSAFRDRYLYPSLHSRAIREFHENVRKMATAKGE